MGQMLGVYHDRVKLAQKWRHGAVCHGLSDEQLQRELGEFEREGVVLPADVDQELLSRETQKLASEKRWAELVEVLIPFGAEGDAEQQGNEGGSFQPLAPRMRDLPRVAAWRVPSFMKSAVG